MSKPNRKSELYDYQKELLNLAQNAERFSYYPLKQSKSWANKLLLSSKLEDFCQRNEIKKLSLFGSVIRDDFNSKSDVDLLVKFVPGKTPGLAIVDLQDELSQMLGREVDLRTQAELSRFNREKVIAEAIVIYDQDRRLNSIETYRTSDS